MRKFVCLICALFIFFSLCVSASASNIPELSYQISFCQKVKEMAHTMADCARWLGYGEDNYIITTSKARWLQADTQEQNLTKELCQALQTNYEKS